jgi:hypothetical protein
MICGGHPRDTLFYCKFAMCIENTIFGFFENPGPYNADFSVLEKSKNTNCGCTKQRQLRHADGADNTGQTMTAVVEPIADFPKSTKGFVGAQRLLS